MQCAQHTGGVECSAATMPVQGASLQGGSGASGNMAGIQVAASTGPGSGGPLKKGGSYSKKACRLPIPRNTNAARKGWDRRLSPS